MNDTLPCSILHIRPHAELYRLLSYLCIDKYAPALNISRDFRALSAVQFGQPRRISAIIFSNDLFGALFWGALICAQLLNHFALNPLNRSA